MPEFVSRLLTSSFAALLVKVGGAAFSYLMFVAIARSMSLEQFGYFSFAFSVSVIFAKIAVAGQQQVVMRELPRNLGEQGTVKRLQVITTRSYLSVLVVSVLLMAFVAAWPMFASATSSGAQLALVVAAFFVPVMAFSELQASTLRAYGSVVLALAPREIVWRGLICVVCFWIAFTAGPSLNAWQGFALCAATLAIVTLVQATLAPGTRVWQQNIDLASFKDREWYRVSSHFWVSSVVTFGAPMLSVVVIGVILSPELAGAFFAALKSSQTINLVLLATNLVASPLVSKAFASGNNAQVQLICALCSGAATVFALFAFALFVVGGELVLGLFGDGFELAYPELLILSAAYVFNAACGPNGAVLEMTKHQDRFMRLIVLSNAAGIISLPVLTYLYGSIGAAISVAGTLVLWNVLAVIASTRHASIDPSIVGILRLMRSRNASEAQ